MPESFNDNDQHPELTRRAALRKGTSVAAGLAVGGAAFSGGADANQPEQYDVAGDVIFNPCTGEDMEVTDGTVQRRRKLHFDGNGAFHDTVHLNSMGVRAVGLESGRKYQINTNRNTSVNFRQPYPSTDTTVTNATVTSQGSAGTHRLKIRFHLTVTAKGDITALKLDGTNECLGRGN